MTYPSRLMISLIIALIFASVLTNALQAIVGQTNSPNNSTTNLKISNEEKRLDPPNPPLLMEPKPQPTPLSEEKSIKIEHQLQEINETPEILITNETIVEPANRTQVNVTKTNATSLSNNLNPKVLTKAADSQVKPSLQIPTLVVIKNKTLTPGATSVSNVMEPSVANKNNTIFYTANKFVARSIDGGENWAYFNPSDYFKDFVGDQDVVYDPIHDIFLWYMQGTNTNSGNNLRLGVSSDATSWSIYTFRARDVNSSWINASFDYPSLSLSKKYLYISTNLYPSVSYPSMIVMRILLDDLAKRIGPLYDYYYDPSLPSEITTFTPVQGIIHNMDGMYWGTLLSNDKMKIYKWSDSMPSSLVNSYERNITSWAPLEKNAGFCPGPDDNNWCSKDQSKIRSGFMANDIIGFFWDANIGTLSSRKANFSFPYINAATFNSTDNMKYLSRPYIWSPTFAWLYGSAAPDNEGNVLIEAFYGGGKYHPSVAAGIGNNFSGSSSPWKMIKVVNGTNGNIGWGDYLRVRPFNGEGPGWIGSGWTLQGGTKRDFLVPYYFEYAFNDDNDRFLRSR
jgi:hypothetical protein